MNDSCDKLAAWLQRVPGQDDESLPPQALVAHAQGCQRCQGMLLALVTDLAGPLSGPIPISCADVEAHIPAMVDYERQFGSAAAARAFPKVWWHALVCPLCAEIYTSLLELADLPELPWQSVAVPVRRVVERRWQLHFQPALVPQLAGTKRQLGVAWGARKTDVLIAEQEDDEGELRLYLRYLPEQEYALVVRTEPAIIGTAQLVIAGQTLNMPLDAAGNALFEGLAEALFRDDSTVVVTVSAERVTKNQ